ncbi:MAG: hypothetical protein HY939_00865 [Gammaproteobacteria bacterium]|nr:hypothetical protein [Gammaproteobacteria bacterium]
MPLNPAMKTEDKEALQKLLASHANTGQHSVIAIGEKADTTNQNSTHVLLGTSIKALPGLTKLLGESGVTVTQNNIKQMELVNRAIISIPAQDAQRLLTTLQQRFAPSPNPNPSSPTPPPRSCSP